MPKANVHRSHGRRVILKGDKKVEEANKSENDSSVAILLPTYCEAENIESLIHTIEKLRINSKIIVIDDSSPDGTGEIVKKLQKIYGNITLLTRPFKSGLGTAITHGFV